MWSTENIPTNMAVQERGGAAGKKESSGLLMSVIRALSSSSTLKQREKEKGRIEKEFRDSERRLDNLVEDHYEDLTSIIKAFSKTSERIQVSRDRIASIKDNLHSCKNLLHCKRDELRKLWIEGVEHRTVVEMFERIEEIKTVPEKLDVFMGKKHYLHATEMLTNAVALLEGDLAEVEGLKELKLDLIGKKKHLFEVILDELHSQIYVKSTKAVVQGFQRSGSLRRDKKETNVPPGQPNSSLLGVQTPDIKSHKRSGSKTQKELAVPASTEPVVEHGQIMEDLTADPEEDQLHFIAVLVESLAILKRLPDAVGVTKQRMQPELIGIIQRASQQVADNAYQQGENIATQNHPRYLLELLELIFQQFRCVAQTHQVVLNNFQRLQTSASPGDASDLVLYDMVEVWSKIQTVLQIFLGDYLDIRNTSSAQQQTSSHFDETRDLASYFAKKKPTKPKKAALFRFDASSHAISMNSYLREQRQEYYGATGEVSGEQTETSPKQLFVCKPGPNNVTAIYNPLQQFIREIEACTNCQVGMCPLQAFLTDFVKKNFLDQVHYNVMSNVATATKGFDALKFITDQKTQKELGVSKPLLQSTVAVNNNIQELHGLMQDLPDYSDEFLKMVCKIMQDYKETCTAAYRDIVQPDSEDSRIISAVWAKDQDINRLLRSLPNWLHLQNEKEAEPVLLQFSEKDKKAMNSKESTILTGSLGSSDANIPSQEIIQDVSQLRTMGNLHESLEWFSNRMKLFANNLPVTKLTVNAPQKNKDTSPDSTVKTLLALASEFQDLADICLLVLHLEVRVHCFYYIIPVAKQSNYSGAIDDMDPDANVLKLNKDLSSIEEAMNQSLQPRKFQYIFDGLGHLISTVLISSTQFLTRINENGIKKMCRNIFAIQQNLSNITSSRETDLDHARDYYELLHLSLGEIITSVMEQGPQFTELEYTHIFTLRQRSRPGSDPEVFKEKLGRLREVLREQHV